MSIPSFVPPLTPSAAVRPAAGRLAAVRLAGVALMTAAPALLSTACRSDAATAVQPALGSAQLQVINAARGPVDVLVDGTVRISALPAASVSSLLGVPAGARRFEVRLVGSEAGRVGTQVMALASRPALVAAQVGSAGALSAAVLDDTAAVPAPGMGKLRVLHLAPNAPAVSIWMLGPGEASRALDVANYGTVTPFRYGGSTSFFQGQPGSWDVVITPETSVYRGSVPPNPSDTAVAVGTLPFDPHTRAIARLMVPVGVNEARTIVMLDAPGGGVRLEATAP